MKRLIKWFFRPSQKPIIEDIDLYQKIIELENRIQVLEECDMEQTNSLYECWNSLDARIDILAEHCKVDYNV